LSADPEARDASDLISKAMIDPFPVVTLTDAQRDAVRSAIEAAPENRIDWAKRRLLIND
jgi:hypothetical protein